MAMTTPSAAPNSRHCIAVSSAGRRVGLMHAFREDAVRLGIDLRILALDVAPELSAACHVADQAIEVPRCSDPSFVATVAAICGEHGVGLLVPTIDPELMPLSESRAQFDQIGVHVVVPQSSVLRVTGDKLHTATQLSAVGIPTPRSMLLADYMRDPDSLPSSVIAKPRRGSASIGIVRSEGPEGLVGIEPEGYLVQECLVGREYTVNAFYSAESELVTAVPHERLEVRAGEVSKGRTVRSAALHECAIKLPLALPGVSGPLCFQAIVAPSGELAVFEINARFGGGYPLAHRAGARFSQWLLEATLGLPSTACDEWRENVLMLRFDEAVYLDG